MPSPRNVAPAAAKPPNVESRELDNFGLGRFERLKKLRLKLAQAQDIPAFCIAHDSVLLAIAGAAPQTLSPSPKSKASVRQSWISMERHFLKR